MKENLKVWNELKAVPAEAKKNILGGRLKGMTDIKPQWRLKMMTEQFGVIGLGWYYDIVKTWTEEHITKTITTTAYEYKSLDNGFKRIEEVEERQHELKKIKDIDTLDFEKEISCYVQINLFIKDGDNWSKPIVGIGGSMLLAKEKYGIHHSDEAYKMATTDALSVAMKQIGVAADVYMGLSDSEYDKPVENHEKPHTVEFKKATESQIKLMTGYMKDFTAKNDSKSVEYIAEHLTKNDLSYEQAEIIINRAKDKLK